MPCKHRDYPALNYENVVVVPGLFPFCARSSFSGGNVALQKYNKHCKNHYERRLFLHTVLNIFMNGLHLQVFFTFGPYGVSEEISDKIAGQGREKCFAKTARACWWCRFLLQ